MVYWCHAGLPHVIHLQFTSVGCGHPDRIYNQIARLLTYVGGTVERQPSLPSAERLRDDHLDSGADTRPGLLLAAGMNLRVSVDCVLVFR